MRLPGRRRDDGTADAPARPRSCAVARRADDLGGDPAFGAVSMAPQLQPRRCTALCGHRGSRCTRQELLSGGRRHPAARLSLQPFVAVRLPTLSWAAALLGSPVLRRITWLLLIAGGLAWFAALQTSHRRGELVAGLLFAVILGGAMVLADGLVFMHRRLGWPAAFSSAGDPLGLAGALADRFDLRGSRIVIARTGAAR